MKNWLTCDANKGRRRNDEGWSKEMRKEIGKDEEGDWSMRENWGRHSTHGLWGDGERKFEGLENEEGILCHFEIFWGYNCPSIV